MTDIEPLEDDTGFLTKRMRAYLRDPDGFEEENGEKAAREIRYRIRQAERVAKKQRNVLLENRGDWDLRQPGKTLEHQPSTPDDAVWTDDEDVDEQETTPTQDDEKRQDEADDEKILHLHEPFPDDHAMAFDIHEDTHHVLEEIQNRLSRFAVDHFVDRLDDEAIPDEFDSRGAYRTYLQDNRQDFRTWIDKQWAPSYEIFRGDDLVTVDDVIRLALGLAPTVEALEEAEEDDLLYSGDHASLRNDLVRAFIETLNENSSSLYRVRSESGGDESAT